jgi:glycosyltransferase 2 family protein
VRHALLILKFAVTFALLGGVLAAADLPVLASLLGDASLGPIVAAVAALVAQTLVLSARFHAIVAALGRRVSAWSAIELSFVGVLFNQALPSAIGGDAIRAWRLRSDGRSWRDAVNAVLLDRAGGVAVLAVLAAVAVFVEPSGALAVLRGPLAVVTAAGIAAFAAVAAADRLPFLPDAVRRFVATSGLPASARKVCATRVLPGTAALSAASHLLAALAAYWLADALGLELGLGIFVTAALCMLLATMIPLSYAGWGIREVGAVWLFTRIGISNESALAISVLFGAALLVAALPGLAFWLSPSWERRVAPSPPAGTP